MKTEGNHGSAKGKLDGFFSLEKGEVGVVVGGRAQKQAQRKFLNRTRGDIQPFAPTANGRLESGHVLATLKY